MLLGINVCQGSPPFDQANIMHSEDETTDASFRPTREERLPVLAYQEVMRLSLRSGFAMCTRRTCSEVRTAVPLQCVDEIQC